MSVGLSSIHRESPVPPKWVVDIQLKCLLVVKKLLVIMSMLLLSFKNVQSRFSSFEFWLEIPFASGFI